MGKTSPKISTRLRRKLHIRKRIHGTGARPRLTVFRSLQHIYAQIIDDEQGVTLVSASTLNDEFKANGLFGGNAKAAEIIGTLVGVRALEAGIESVVFDRNGFLYHGRVKALAEAARKSGLRF